MAVCDSEFRNICMEKLAMSLQFTTCHPIDFIFGSVVGFSGSAVWITSNLFYQVTLTQCRLTLAVLHCLAARE